MSVPTHDPTFCFFGCVYFFAKGTEYSEKGLCGFIRATRGIQIFAIISMHGELKSVKGPPKYLIARVSMCVSLVILRVTDERDRLQIRTSIGWGEILAALECLYSTCIVTLHQIYFPKDLDDIIKRMFAI